MKRTFLLIYYIVGISALPLSAQTYAEWCERAIRATEQDSLELAEKYIRAALKTEPANPHNALLFSNLGTIQRTQGKWEQALESYSFALNIAPRAVPILMNRATLYLELGKDDLARIDYSLVLDLDKENTEALLMRAYIYANKRDYKQARADYEALLKLEPANYNGRLGLVTLEQLEGKLEAALALLDGMLANREGWSNEEVALLYVARAGVERQMKHLDAALLDLEEACRFDDKQTEVYLMRGEIYLEQGKKQQAKRDFERMMQLGVPQSELRGYLQQCR